MPETPFTVELPDGTQRSCYSPSSVVKQYFSVGDKMTSVEFEEKATAALTIASQRVQKKFGFTCSAASSSLAEIKSFCAPLSETDIVSVIEI